jgi:hypothetical protein
MYGNSRCPNPTLTLHASLFATNWTQNWFYTPPHPLDLQLTRLSIMRYNHMGWLTNYPGLTPKVVRRNKPHSPATALGHITASRAGVRSSRLTPDDSPKLALSAQPSAFVEALDHYSEHELPDIVLRCTVQHCSAFRRDAIYSDLPGRFPVRAKDGSEYLLLSVYKNYIEPSPLRCILGHSHVFSQTRASTKGPDFGQRNFRVSLHLLRYPAHRVPTCSPQPETS